MLFGFLNNVRAGSDIPIQPDDNNAWTWEVNVNNELAYEVEMIMTDYETGDLYWQMRYLDILRISDIDSDFFEFMGEYDNMSYVEAYHYYYECYPEGGGEVVEIEDQSPDKISVFGYNDSDIISEKFIAASESMFYPPLLLPLNDSDICPTMDDIIYEGQIKYFENIYTNVFDDRGLETVVGDRYKIWFQNTTEDYFMNCTYFKNNGTLESAEAYFLMKMGENGGDWGAINLTMTRVYGPDYCAAITDEVVWNFDVGDDFYFGVNEDEYMITITNKTWCMSFETHTMDLEIPQPYNVVNASLHKWDKESEAYSIDEGEQIIALANNYYPFPLEAFFEGGGPVLAVPDGTDDEDMAFLLNNFTMEEWPFEVYITDNGKTIELTDKEEGGTMSLQYDDLGIMKIGYMEFGGWLEGVYFRKNMTILDDGAYWEPLGWDMVGSNNDVLVNFTATADLELYSAVLPVNPLETLVMEDDSYLGCYFEHEIPDLPLYIDMYVNDSGAVGDQVWMNITYDQQPFDDYDILETAIKLYGFNFSGFNEWDEAPDTMYLVDDVTNVITANATYAISNKFSYFTIGVEESWNWSQELYDLVDDGDDNNLLIYEMFGEMSGTPDPELGEFEIPFVQHNILNITGIEVVNKEWTFEEGVGEGTDDFNQINSTLLYWQPDIGGLEQDTDVGTFTLAEYCFNQSRDLQMLYTVSLYTLMIPIIVPLRWDELYLKTIGLSINETFYSSNFSKEAGFPIWDEIYSNPIDRTLIFNETTSDYYMELKYFDNGTLEEADFLTKFEFGDDGETQMVELELRADRKYDVNTTDEVEWGVEVGDSYYFGSNFPDGGATLEVNITITKFNQSAVNTLDLVPFGDGNGNGGDDPLSVMFYSWLTWENVWADVWIWNATGESSGEWMYVGEILIGAANNYYPFPIGDYYYAIGLDGFMVPVVIPKDFTGYDLAETFGDFFRLMMMMMYEGEIIGTIDDVADDHMRIDFYAPDYPSYDRYLEWYIDLDTGVSRLFYMYESYLDDTSIVALFRKNHTRVLGAGYSKFEFDTYLVDPINASVVIDSPDSYDFFEAILHRNPVNGSLSGNPIFYTDLFLINTSSELYNLTFYIYLPATYNLNYFKSIAVYHITGYDDVSDKFLGAWETYNFDDPDSNVEIIKYTHNNTLVLRSVGFPGGIPLVLAWLYSPPAAADGGGGGGGDGDKEPAPIPGYDIYILLMMLSLISIIVIVQRRKKIRF